MSASYPSSSSRPTAASWTTGSPREAVRVRHGGAHLEGISKEPSSAAGISPRTCALARRHPHRGDYRRTEVCRLEDLTFIRPAARRLGGPGRGWDKARREQSCRREVCRGI